VGAINDKLGLTDEFEARLVRAPVRFAIFYADGSVVEDDGVDETVTFRVPRAWLRAPCDGVQFVVAHRSDGRLQVLQNHDIYMTMPNGEPIASNDMGAQLRSVGIAKYGLWIPDQEYFAIRERVREYRRVHEEKQQAKTLHRPG